MDTTKIGQVYNFFLEDKERARATLDSLNVSTEDIAKLEDVSRKFSGWGGCNKFIQAVSDLGIAPNLFRP